MKVLITGGSGFVGSHIADRLLARNNQVLVIDNFTTGRRDNLKPRQNLTVIEETIANTAAMEQIFTKFKEKKKQKKKQKKKKKHMPERYRSSPTGLSQPRLSQ